MMARVYRNHPVGEVVSRVYMILNRVLFGSFQVSRNEISEVVELNNEPQTVLIF